MREIKVPAQKYAYLILAHRQWEMLRTIIATIDDWHSPLRENIYSLWPPKDYGLESGFTIFLCINLCMA